MPLNAVLYGPPMSRLVRLTAATLNVATLVAAMATEAPPAGVMGLAGVLGLAGVFGFLGLVAWDRSPSWGAAATIMTACFVGSTLLDLRNSATGSTVLGDAGSAQLTQAYVALCLCALIHAVAIADYFQRRSQKLRRGIA